MLADAKILSIHRITYFVNVVIDRRVDMFVLQDNVVQELYVEQRYTKIEREILHRIILVGFAMIFYKYCRNNYIPLKLLVQIGFYCASLPTCLISPTLRIRSLTINGFGDLLRGGVPINDTPCANNDRFTRVLRHVSFIVRRSLGVEISCWNLSTLSG